MDERNLELKDLARIVAVEDCAYAYPWSTQHFRDSFAAGHRVLALELSGSLLAYAVLMPVLDETHLLNLTVERNVQGQGLGRAMLRLAMRVASNELNGRSMLLEVRPSNTPALGLYASMGFKRIGQRKDYYPSAQGREDAWVFRRDLP